MFLAENLWRTRWENKCAYDREYKNRKLQPFISKIDSYVPPPARVLDIGCGTQQLSRILTDKGYTVFGVDLRHGAKGKFAFADARKLPFKDESFDVVTGVMLLEDLHDFQDPQPADYNSIVKEAHRVLRKGGLLALDDTMHHNASFECFSRTAYNDDHYGFFSK